MKLKKLLPLATVAGVAAIVAPIVTSCSCSGNSAYWEKGKTYHALDPKAATSYADETELTKAYHDDLAKNKLIYADDIVNYFANLPDENIEIRKVKYTVKEVGDLEDFSSKEYSATKSFRISIEIEIDATIKYDVHTFEYSNRKATLNNIPVVLEFQKDGVDIEFDSDADYMNLANDDKWSINMPEIILNTDKLSIGDNNKDYNKENIPDKTKDPYIAFAFNIITGYMVCVENSNYYKQVTKSK